MTATVTDVFKRFLVDYTYDDFYDSDTKYYIGIGRTQPWDFPDSDLSPPFPDPSSLEVRNFRDNLQTMKRVSDIAHVVIRYNWTNGAIYSGWNDKYHSENVFVAGQDETDPYYVINSKNGVYVCLKAGVGPEGLVSNSTVPPNDTSGEPFETSDGYQWLYLYTIGTNDTQKFLTSSYMPAQKIIDSDEGGPINDDLDPFQQEQARIQRTAVPGEILGVDIERSGTNFTDGVYEIAFDGAPVIDSDTGAELTITDARAWATAFGGRIVDVSMKDPSTGIYHFGQNYYDATVRFVSPVGGSGFKLRPIIGPAKGIQAEAEIDLNSTALMYNVILLGQEEGAAIVDNDFRQVGLIRNPEEIDSDGAGNPAVGIIDTTVKLVTNAIKYNVLDIGVGLDLGNIVGDNIMTGQTSGASAIINTTDDINELFYYTQTRETGYKKFQIGEPLDISNGGGVTSVVDIIENSFVKQSGDVYYIDSRRPFMRNNEQSEDIKLIIDF